MNIKSLSEFKKLSPGTTLILKKKSNQIFTPGSEPIRKFHSIRGHIAVLLNEQNQECYLPLPDHRCFKSIPNGFQIISFGRVSLEYHFG